MLASGRSVILWGMTIRRFLTPAVLAAASVALLAGCGGGDTKVDVSSPQTMAKGLGCTYQSASTEELYVKEVGKCSFQSKDVRLLTFNDSDGRSNFVQTASAYGSTYVYGDKWAVETSDASTAKAVQGKLGGDIK